MQLVVPSAVRNAVSAATITFTASSTILCFFMIYNNLFFLNDNLDNSDNFFDLWSMALQTVFLHWRQVVAINVVYVVIVVV